MLIKHCMTLPHSLIERPASDSAGWRPLSRKLPVGVSVGGRLINLFSYLHRQLWRRLNDAQISYVAMYIVLSFRTSIYVQYMYGIMASTVVAICKSMGIILSRYFNTGENQSRFMSRSRLIHFCY
jgi:hypothetical protein